MSCHILNNVTVHFLGLVALFNFQDTILCTRHQEAVFHLTFLAHPVTLGGFFQWQSLRASALLQGSEQWPGNTALCCLAIPSPSRRSHLLTPSLPWFGSIFFLSHPDLEGKTNFGSQPSALRFKNQYKSWRKQH